MNWSLFRTQTFLRTARLFFRKHPERLPEFEVILRQLAEDPFVPRLRLHALKGRHRGKHAVSLAYDVRLVLTLRISKKEIYLLDLGTHEEVYR